MKSILEENIPNELYQSVVVLYGAGITCRRILSLLEPYQIDIRYIIDDDIYKAGTKVENIEIISRQKFENICKDFQNICIVMATIYGKTVLKRLNKIENINIYEMYDWLDKVYNLNTLVDGINDRYRVIEFKNQCCVLKDKLIEQESRDVIDGLCTYLDTKNSNIISDICTEYDQYFIPEVLAAICKPIVVVDGGGYGGELYQTMKKYNIPLKCCYCFEADVKNYEKILAQSVSNGLQDIQICINKGLWKEMDTLYFDGGKDTSSRIVSYETENQVDVISLDSFFQEKKCDYIKMDIEGAEYPALCGGIETIKRDRPILAISIYHSLEDYYRIPNLLMQELHDYKYFIRHHALILAETVLYAIPMELVNDYK